MNPQIAVIVPTLNEADRLSGLLDDLAGQQGVSIECWVSDGGSEDGTTAKARAAGVRICNGLPGRGAQMNRAAARARAPWLLFLHADSRLQRGWQVILRGFTGNQDNHFKAAYFQLILDDTAPAARRVENLANWRARHLGLPYGDQGLVISRPFYDFLEGFRPLPIMEDVDLVRRIGGRRLVMLPSAVTTSARRYRRDGWWLRPALNLCCLGLFYAGLPPHWIERLYR